MLEKLRGIEQLRNAIESIAKPCPTYNSSLPNPRVIRPKRALRAPLPQAGRILGRGRIRCSNRPPQYIVEIA